MARGIDTTTLLIIGGIGYLWYTGQLQQILSGLGGPRSVPPTTQPGAPPSPVQPPPPQGTLPHPCDTSFIPGQRYVARLPNGCFEVVIGGVRVFTSCDQGEAEREYNRRVCGG